MDFFKKSWVTVLAVICAIISIVLFALHGFTQVEIAPFFDAIWTVVDVVGLLVIAIKKLLQKKDTAGK